MNLFNIALFLYFMKYIVFTLQHTQKKIGNTIIHLKHLRFVIDIVRISNNRYVVMS